MGRSGSVSIGTRLRDALKTIPMKFQVQGVRFVEKCGGRALIGDDMGLGKTLQSLGWAAMHPELRPIIVVCPSTLKLNWRKELRKHAQLRCQVLNGRHGYGMIYRIKNKKKGKRKDKDKKKKKNSKKYKIQYKWFDGKRSRRKWWRKNRKKYEFVKRVTNDPPLIKKDIVIINFEILSSWAPILLKLKPQLLIIDECHYVKEMTRYRTKACKLLAKKIPYMIALSGTPITNRPAEFFPVLNMIDPVEWNSFFRYAMRYCNLKIGFQGRWDSTGASNLDELHEKVSKIMIRRLKKDVLSELPEKQRIFIPMEIDNRREYNEACENFLKWLGKRKGKEAVKRAASAQGLIRYGKLKELVAKGKYKGMVQWIKDYLYQTDKKLVIFCYHVPIFEKLKKSFPDAAFGKKKGKEKEREKERFQTDINTKLFIGSMKADGIGHTLTAASSTVFLEIGDTPGQHDQCEDRVNRIGQEADSIEAYYLMGEDTVDEDNWERIEEKRDVCEQVLDGKQPKSDEEEMEVLLKHLRRRHEK